ncbi:MAG TPA: 4-hydroxy-tetrahydrodipicolinate synthase [Candidatus Kapabacteria bacterium]|nr:4-hydroxy-tetrahydrodipicolinate synthase [Candidatus Kapabacteria bacterium]
MSSHKFEGTITAIVTPFKKDLSIDFDKFKNLIDFQINNGVDGIVVCGSTGEAATMNHKEKLSLIITAVEHSNGRVPIIAGTGSNNTSDSIDFTFLAKEHGADASLLVAPYYNKPTQEGLYNHFRAIADSCDIPIMLYNVPSRSTINISAEIQLKLAEDYKNIIATKEASGNLEQMSEIIKHAPSHFHLMSGDDALALPIIAIGGKGVVSVISNYLPQQFSQMVKLALEYKIEEARQLYFKMLELMKINFVESNPTPAKAIMSKMGLLENHLRLPLMPITKHNMKVIVNIMESSELFN